MERVGFLGVRPIHVVLENFSKRMSSKALRFSSFVSAWCDSSIRRSISVSSGLNPLFMANGINNAAAVNFDHQKSLQLWNGLWCRLNGFNT